MDDQNGDQLRTKDDIVAMLSPTLGREKSDQVVSTALEVLELSSDALRLEEVIRVLDVLGRGTGLVGITARLARQRMRPSRSEAPPPSAEQPSSGGSSAPESARTVSKAPPKRRPSAAVALSVTRQDLVDQLTPTVGRDKANTLVREAILAALGVESAALTLEQASRVLGYLAEMEGIVGTAASFAKARLLLRAPK